MRASTSVIRIGSVLALLTVTLTASAWLTREHPSTRLLVTAQPLDIGGRTPLCIAIPANGSTDVSWWESWEKNCKVRSSSVVEAHAVSVSRSGVARVFDFQIGLHRGIANVRVVAEPTRILAVKTGNSQPRVRMFAEPTDPFELGSRRLVDTLRPCDSRALARMRNVLSGI